MILKVDPILCNNCYECHIILPFMCAPDAGLDGMPAMAKGPGGFFVNRHWGIKYFARFHAAVRSCKAGALRIDEE